jgi:squalene-hopene/tetraprenyl-beta-curcumene cyclase
MIDSERLLRAYETARRDLLAEREASGHWSGHLASSALSTATAVSALSVMDAGVLRILASEATIDPQQLVAHGIEYLVGEQNSDGGWGDTDQSLPNIATTMLVEAAFRLAGVAEKHADALARAANYVRDQGGIAGLRRRYGVDKTFAVPILTNCAIAGLVSWNEVAPLPFELACFPQSWFRLLRLPVVSYAIPALVAVGQARHFNMPSRNSVVRLIRNASVERSRNLLEKMQPASGGFLEATPLTSFVVMSLASIGQSANPVARLGTQFLLRSARPDGSWPIDTNLATWLTTLSLNALPEDEAKEAGRGCLDWLLACQHNERHPFTGAAPGGWGWSDLSGAVPDADDTAGALLALARLADGCDDSTRTKLEDRAQSGIQWLLGLQNSDGGFPTFCRGWGKLPFDRSGSDLTAHAVRAMETWRLRSSVGALKRIEQARQRALRYLSRHQRPDGSWVPLWFGNQFDPEEHNPIYGTSRVLLVYRDLGLTSCREARRGAAFLAASQNDDGGWGARAGLHPSIATARPGSSVEETALAVEALGRAEPAEALQSVFEQGVNWLIRVVEEGRHGECSPIGFYFAKLWYHERLYPLVFTVSALGEAARRLPGWRASMPTVARL